MDFSGECPEALNEPETERQPKRKPKMKKLMFAVAAIAAGAAMADVTSANVVGYQNKELAGQANSFVAMTLMPIGIAKADVTLSQFVPTDGEAGWMYNADYLMTLKPNGTTEKTYG